MSDFVTRFAPSPTGELHLGSAFSALVAYDAARAADGRFLLRIEDIDHTRCRPAYIELIYEALHWLGLEWDTPVRVQSSHIEDYRAALASLDARGLVYRCFKSRAEIDAERVLSGATDREIDGEAPGYAGPVEPLSKVEEDAKLASGAPFAWRLSLKSAKAALGARYDALVYREEAPDGSGATKRNANPQDAGDAGDAVLWRKDGAPSYQLAVVYDDALQDVSHVIRGDDLRPSTSLQVLLQALLDLPTPIYRHHRLLLGADGKRYSKRDKSLTIRALREAGATPDDIRARVGLRRD